MTNQHPSRPEGSEPAADPAAQRRVAVRKALERHAKKLARRLDALRGDLGVAARAGEWRRYGEALPAFAHLVPARAQGAPRAPPRGPPPPLSGRRGRPPPPPPPPPPRVLRGGGRGPSAASATSRPASRRWRASW